MGRTTSPSNIAWSCQYVEAWRENTLAVENSLGGAECGSSCFGYLSLRFIVCEMLEMVGNIMAEGVIQMKEDGSDNLGLVFAGEVDTLLEGFFGISIGDGGIARFYKTVGAAKDEQVAKETGGDRAGTNVTTAGTKNCMVVGLRVIQRYGLLHYASSTARV